MTIEELRMARREVGEKAAEGRKKLDEDFDSAIAEANGIAEIAENTEKLLAHFDAEFEEKTGFNRIDWTFLWTAVSLQVIRQVIINKIASIDTERQLKAHDDKDIKSEERAAKDKFKNENLKDGESPKEGKYKSWTHILYDSVPYDVTKHTKDVLGVGLDGNTHRRRTFGHDPCLGWIFGTANIITDTISLSNFQTYRVYRADPITGLKCMGIEPGQISFFTPFVEAMESIREDRMRLPAAIVAQGKHLASDRYTKKMLPIPMTTILPENICGALYDSQWTEFTVAKKAKEIIPSKFASEAMFSVLINMIIGLVHGIFYDPREFPDRTLYEVKTRKVILYSNLIATSSNLFQASIRAACEDPTAAQSIDLGGLVVTLYRLMADTDFIRKAKDMYTFGKIEELVEKEMRNV